MENNEFGRLNALVPLLAFARTLQYPGMPQRVGPGVVQTEGGKHPPKVLYDMHAYRIKGFPVRRWNSRSSRCERISRSVVLRILRKPRHATQGLRMMIPTKRHRVERQRFSAYRRERASA